jgi:hypothetical protein
MREPDPPEVVEAFFIARDQLFDAWRSVNKYAQMRQRMPKRAARMLRMLQAAMFEYDTYQYGGIFGEEAKALYADLDRWKERKQERKREAAMN